MLFSQNFFMLYLQANSQKIARLLFRRADFGISVPRKQRFLCFVAVDLRNVADIEIMVAHFVVFFQVTDNRNAAVDRNLNRAAFNAYKLDVEFRRFVRVAAGGAAAAEHRVRNFCTGNGQNDFLVLPYHFAAVRRLCHGVSNHVRVIREIGPPRNRGKIGRAVRLLGAHKRDRIGGGELRSFR